MNVFAPGSTREIARYPQPTTLHAAGAEIELRMVVYERPGAPPAQLVTFAFPA